MLYQYVSSLSGNSNDIETYTKKKQIYSSQGTKQTQLLYKLHQWITAQYEIFVESNEWYIA